MFYNSHINLRLQEFTNRVIRLIAYPLLIVSFTLFGTSVYAKKPNVNTEIGDTIISGYIQMQFQATSEDDEVPNNTFRVRRGRLKLESKLTESLLTTFEINAATDGVTAKDVYLRYKISPAFSIRVGQIKKSFSFTQLQAPRKSPMIERPLYVRKKFECYLGRDIGLMVDWEPLKRLELNAGVYNGTDSDLGLIKDNNNAKDFAGRAELSLVKGLKIAFNASSHGLSGEDSDSNSIISRRVNAYGADISLQRSGFQIVGESMFGDRPKIGDAQMVGYSITMTHKHELSALGLIGIKYSEYGGRAEYMDGDSTDDNDAVTAITPYIGFYFHSNARLQFCPIIQFPQEDETILEFTMQAQIEF